MIKCILSIQFRFCIAKNYKSQTCFKGLYSLYTYDIPVPGAHIGSGKTPPKTLDGIKREDTFKKDTEEDPVYTINNITELQHIQ